MRYLLIPILAMSIGTAHAAVHSGAADPKAEVKAVNTIDPNTGAKVDATIAPIAGKTTDGKSVWIGVSDQASSDTITKDPAKYANAAAANTKLDVKAK